VNALARVFEAAGLSTVVINIMPVFGERLGAPRTLGVEFPFGHPVGPPGDAALQTRVVEAALDLLVRASPPAPVVAHFPEPWPGDFDVWKRAWHPREPSPVIRLMRERARERPGPAAPGS
jgi:D-proline reductase (dithiol) PrdB